MSLDFGSSGVTARIDVTGLNPSGWPSAHSGPASSTPNFMTFIDPDPPADSRWVGQGTAPTPPASWLGMGVSFNKPLIGPILSVYNLDGSSLAVSGTTTTGNPLALTTLVKNNALEVSGNTLNTGTIAAAANGCEANDGSNGNGGCGSFRMGSTGNPIQNFSMRNNGVWGDGWNWSLAFPTAELTKAFSPARIPVDGTSALTFTITNPTGPGQIALAPLDFTDSLPAGLVVADSTVTNNGSCGPVTVTDAAGGALAAGATSVRAANANVAVGATCTITVNVRSATPGAYTNNNDNLSTSVGNLVPNARTSLEVYPRADLSIDKRATSSPAFPGRDITYELVVRNNGPSAATNVRVSDPLPSNLSYVSSSAGCSLVGATVDCTLGSLAAAATHTFTVTARVADAATGELVNDATVGSDTEDPDPRNNRDTERVPVEPLADLEIVKRALTDRVVPGRQVAFELIVTNHGPSVARDVRMSDPLPRGLSFVSASSGCSFAGGSVTCTAGELASGRSIAFRVVTRVGASVTADSITNTASVESTTRDPDPGNNRDTERVPSGPEADVSITKIPSVDRVAVGGQLFYTLLVRNDGPSDAQNVVVTDTAGAGLTLLSARGGQGTSCTVAAARVTCRLGTLAAGGSAQVLVSARADRAGELTNTAKVDTTTKDPDPSNNRDERRVTGDPPPTTAPQPADLEIVKTSNRRAVLGSGTITYTLRIRNNGPGAATGVQVIDTPSLPVKVRSVRTSAGRCTTTTPIRCDLGTLASGASATVRIVAQPQAPGMLRNSASVTGDVPDPRTENNIDGTSTRVQGLLKVKKSVSAKTVRAGGTVTYKIRVSNASAFALRSVRVCDDLPSGLVFVSSTPKAKLSKGKHCWTIRALGAKKSKTFTMKVRVLRGAGGRKVNVATATAPNARGARSRAATGTAAIRVLPVAARGGGVTG
jgi:uncharacterized repeat protein (TIGR01451 family)